MPATTYYSAVREGGREEGAPRAGTQSALTPFQMQLYPVWQMSSSLPTKAFLP